MTIPSSVTSIGNDAFYGCSGLIGVTIPSSVTSIGAFAFYNCSLLSSVNIPSSVTSIGDGAYAGCRGLSVDTANQNYCTVNSVLFNKLQTTLVQYPSNVSGTYVIPGSVTSIGNDAFYGCSGLTGVTIPSSVTSIGICAFYHCSGLYNVTIPGSVTNIGIGAFAFSNITSVTIPSSVTSIGTYAFAYCFNLTSGFFTGNAPTADKSTFSSSASSFKIYYTNGATGFDSFPWNTWSTENIGTYSAVKPWLITKGFSYNADLSSIPNRDGVPLLMSYALNLDPTKNQSRNLPKPYVSGSNLCLTYYAANLDVTYHVQTSTDMQNWTTDGVALSGPDGNGCYTASIPMGEVRRFMRLLVTH